MARQLVLDLPVREARGRGDFFIAPPNALALAALDGWRDWPGGKLLLTGPRGAGKSHLAQVWATETGAIVIDASDLATAALPDIAAAGHATVEDVDRVAGNEALETALFHLHNLLAAQDGRLLLTAKNPVSGWGLRLADLHSRMAATAVARIDLPDDTLLGALLVKLFADRQLAVPAAIIPFLVSRMERSFGAARDLVAELDRAALAERRPVNRQLAAEVLDRLMPGSA